MKERPLLPSSESFTTRQDLQGIVKEVFFMSFSFLPLKREIAVTNILSNIRQNNFTGHKYHASSYETWLGGFGEKMHSEVPFAAWGRNIFCQEASPGRLVFIFLVLSIFKLFVICICCLWFLCYVYMEQSRATDSPFFKLICPVHWWLSLERFWTFLPFCFSLLFITVPFWRVL